MDECKPLVRGGEDAEGDAFVTYEVKYTGVGKKNKRGRPAPRASAPSHT